MFLQLYGQSPSIKIQGDQEGSISSKDISNYRHLYADIKGEPLSPSLNLEFEHNYKYRVAQKFLTPLLISVK